MRLFSCFLVVICLPIINCASEPASEAAGETFGMVWGAASVDEQCVAPLMDKQGFPAEGDPLYVDRVIVRLEDLLIDGVPKTRQRIFQYSKAQLTSDNHLLVDQVTADTDFNLRIAGCREGQLEPVWTGFRSGIRVKEFSKIAPSIFITTEAALSCPSENINVGNRNIGESTPADNAAFSTVVATPDNHFLVAGGVVPDGTSLSTTDSVSLFHTETGAFFTLSGNLTTARAMAGGALIGSGKDQKIAIFGGTPSLEPSAGKTEYPYVYPGSSGGGFTAESFVETIDPDTGASTPWKVPAEIEDSGLAMPAFSSSHYASDSDTLFVVGGYSDGSLDDADPVALENDNVFVIPGMKTLVGAEAGVEKSALIHTLQHPRVGATLLASPDGGVVAFGGNADGVEANVAEWIPSTDNAPELLTVESAAAVPSVAFSASFLLNTTDSEKTYLLVGGIPALLGQYPTSAIVNEGGFASVVRVGQGADRPTVSVESLELGVYGQRVFAAAFRINENQIGLAGGLVALTEAPSLPVGVCVDGVDGQCTRNDLTVFSWVNDQVTAEEGVGELALNATVGSASASLAGGGVLFTAGLHKLEDETANESRQPVIWNPLLTSESKLCPVENCADQNQSDEDLDGLVNCADPECADQAPCSSR